MWVLFLQYLAFTEPAIQEKESPGEKSIYSVLYELEADAALPVASKLL